MNLSRSLQGLGLLGACLAVVAASRAAADKPKEDAKAKDRAEAILSLSLAHDLEEQGRKTKSPLALITAAEILRKIKVKPVEMTDEPKVEVKEGKPLPDGRIDPALTLPEQEQILLKDARSWIDKQLQAKDLTKAEADALRTMATRVEKMKLDRGAIGGPKQRTGYLRPGYTHAYRLIFQGQVTAYVRVFGNEETTLQVTVTDATGQVRGVDSGYNPGGTWVPPVAGEHPFTIRVTNSGQAPAQYRLVTN
jgi:hypothetical protein